MSDTSSPVPHPPATPQDDEAEAKPDEAATDRAPPADATIAKRAEDEAADLGDFA
ncbi:hypothetical protein [Sphingomonas sp. SORGH_AS_0879]|uniref:hypothetical protein n=1 Tax=Sphingomonas sp. SORGH_AS_0879 TaxID=3041790 RepID=UPI002789527E|nr:hypothetical protein [Sphingomonas sp. SORGH_AS_0879]MDQ1229801.1 hypothetical protein [Sphingomonas sp. SORGH_AS_0879]